MIFDFFTRKPTNVLQFPETKTPYIEPPKQKSEVVYSIGVTAEGTHMTFSMGYSTLTMTQKGCEDLIEQLEVFKNQLRNEE
jgi:hypothetical protein